MELYWDELENQQMDERESLGGRALTALRSTLARLELDPFDPRLGTRTFSTPGFGHVRATPTGHAEDVVLWTNGAEPDSLLIMAISPRTP